MKTGRLLKPTLLAKAGYMFVMTYMNGRKSI